MTTTQARTRAKLDGQWRCAYQLWLQALAEEEQALVVAADAVEKAEEEVTSHQGRIRRIREAIKCLTT